MSYQYSEQLFFLAYINLAVGFSIPVTLIILVTFQYLFVPKEFDRIRIDLPNYVSLPVMRALIVLVLLSSIWWVYHAFFMINLDAFEMGTQSVAYRIVGASEQQPKIADFFRYSFSLMINSNYVEMEPVSSIAKNHALFVSATGILLFVVFIGVALSNSPRKPDLIQPE